MVLVLCAVHGWLFFALCVALWVMGVVLVMTRPFACTWLVGLVDPVDFMFLQWCLVGCFTATDSGVRWVNGDGLIGMGHGWVRS